MNQKQVQHGFGAYTWLLLIYSTHEKQQPGQRNTSINKSQGWGMIEETMLRLFRFATRKNGDAGMSLDIALMTLTNQFT